MVFKCTIYYISKPFPARSYDDIHLFPVQLIKAAVQLRLIHM